MGPFSWYRRLIRHPQYGWLVILASLLYLVSPIDLSPDVFPVLGQIDDFVIVTLLFSELFQRLLGGAIAPGAPNAAERGESPYDTPDDPNVKTVDVKAVPVDQK
ncbi:MAG: YkvA family protein [Synechococcales bacterium]|nr:YkvA family protein [Synechococcales bacterium]